MVDAMRRLKDHGFLNWVRRTEKTGNEPGEGPRVKQATNAYFFDLHRLHKRAQMRLAQLLRKCMPAGTSTADSLEGAEVAREPACDPKLASILARMEAAFEGEGASSDTGRNPGKNYKRDKDCLRQALLAVTHAPPPPDFTPQALPAP
ncbi:hypothetical protein ACFSUK_08290 [Sphingobium scionense]